MLYAAQDFVLLKNAPWTAIFPGFAIFVTVLCLNYIGGALRDAWDPKVKNSGESAGF
jgi:peptide/nickel transport system permease protein